MRLRLGLAVTMLSPCLLVAQPDEARACGGCFHPSNAPMATVVTAHRMAFATSGTRTVLWDQIRYAGSPTEFSWVLPVKGQVRLEASTDAWFEALGTVTNARVSPPVLNCYQRVDRDGCSCGSVTDDRASLAPSAGGRDISGNGVVVTHEGSVGPYQYVQVEG